MTVIVERPYSAVCLITTVVLAGLLPWLLSLLTHAAFGETAYRNDTVHAVFELAGSGIAVGVAALFTLRMRDRVPAPHLRWAIAALVGMGLFDAAHSLVTFGVAWSWLRHSATLTGGLCFALVWLPGARVSSGLPKWWLPSVAALASGAAVTVWWQAELLPAPFGPEGFTLAAKATNVVGGAGFLAAALFFFRRDTERRAGEDLIFAGHTLLFAMSSFLFAWSFLWDGTWWL
jgi:hypothetical protein